MAGIVIIDFLSAPAGRWQVNLTDGVGVWRRRHHEAWAALTDVTALQPRGHRVCFPSALAELRDEAAARLLDGALSEQSQAGDVPRDRVGAFNGQHEGSRAAVVRAPGWR